MSKYLNPRLRCRNMKVKCMQCGCGKFFATGSGLRCAICRCRRQRTIGEFHGAGLEIGVANHDAKKRAARGAGDAAAKTIAPSTGPVPPESFAARLLRRIGLRKNSGGAS